jgi:molybdopterin/thiamine biosynthesis adenylyltransferase
MREAQPAAATKIEIEEDRFSRLRLIRWWDQKKIGNARVLVVGAGALGNEILKNLALLGFKQILVVDLDRIEVPNLASSVLYRPDDVGEPKASAAARAVKGICADAVTHSIDANILYGVGLGVFRWADVIFGGLDNREARLWINRSAWKMDRPWIDGAIEGINGVARAFAPGEAPCYECTLGEVDWQILDRRMSCNLLTHGEMEEGKVPTTSTMSSIIAGVQVQEAVKMLHGLPALLGRGLVFEGLNHTSYVVNYTENPDCMSHYQFDDLRRLDLKSSETTLADLHRLAVADLGTEEVTLEFSRDVIEKLACRSCGREEERFTAVGTISVEQGRCACDGSIREVITTHGYSGSESYGDRPLTALGLPSFDVVVARGEAREVQYLLAGDEGDVLGPLA